MANKVPKRYIRNKTDLKAVAAGYRFDKARADHVVNFFTHLRHTIGEWAGKPLELLKWQIDDIIYPLFGWVDKDGLRRFRTAYIEIAKKNGKSTMCSGLALYLLAGDNEPGAQVYTAAASRDQATIVYREASKMATGSPLLRDYVVPRDSVKHLSIPSTNSFLKALAADSFRQEGINWNGLIFDELHAQPDRRLWDALRYGGASRREPLLISITTAGFDRHSICYEQRLHAERVLEGNSEDLNFFGYIRAAEPEDDWGKLKTWKKANPSLGVTVKTDDLKSAYIEAKENPTKENAFKRYRLNVWTEQDERWMSMQRWDQCAGEVIEAELQGRECFAGLDLASTRDVAAFCMVFKEPDGSYSVIPRFWIPKENALERVRRDRVPYLTWAKAGLVTLTEGDIIDFDVIRRDIQDLGDMYNVQEVAIDRWNAAQITTQLAGDGFEMISFGQGFASMSSPTKELEKLIYSKQLKHGGNPVLRWMMANCAIETDAAGNIKVSKKRSQEKIDGIVSLIMAIGRLAVTGEPVKSAYSDHGIQFI